MTRHDYQRIVELQRFRGLAERAPARLRSRSGSSKRFYNDNKKLGIDGVNELADIYALWQRQFDNVAASAKKLGKAEAEYVKLSLDLTEYKRLRGRAGCRAKAHSSPSALSVRQCLHGDGCN